MKRQQVAEATANKNRWLLETFAFPYIGRRRSLRSHRPNCWTCCARWRCAASSKRRNGSSKSAQVFRFPIVEGRAEADPTASLKGALKTPKTKHRAAITEPKNDVSLGCYLSSLKAGADVVAFKRGA